MARRIRVWKDDALYHATYNCIDRMFLLKPSKKVNQIIGACLGRALKRYPVRLHSFTTNINHLEIIFSLIRGKLNNASSFLQYFAGLAARKLNRLLGREGHFWSERARVEEIISDNKAEKFLGYGACNPVKDGLVEKAKEWEGFSTNNALLKGQKLVFEYENRTKWWKSGADHKPVDPKEYMEQVEVMLYPIPSWKMLSKSQRQKRFRQIIHNHEAIARRDRRAEGIEQVKGMARIHRESPFSKPKRPRKKTPQPLCHADTKADYLKYEEDYKETVKAHREASAAYRSGQFHVEFPKGTFRPPLVTVCQQVT